MLLPLSQSLIISVSQSQSSPLPISYLSLPISVLPSPNLLSSQEEIGHLLGIQPVQDITLRRALPSVGCSAVAILQFFIIFEQRMLHFHFALTPANYVADPDWEARITRNSEALSLAESLIPSLQVSFWSS